MTSLIRNIQQSICRLTVCHQKVQHSRKKFFACYFPLFLHCIEFRKCYEILVLHSTVSLLLSCLVNGLVNVILCYVCKGWYCYLFNVTKKYVRVCVRATVHACLMVVCVCAPAGLLVYFLCGDYCTWLMFILLVFILN